MVFRIEGDEERVFGFFGGVGLGEGLALGLGGIGGVCLGRFSGGSCGFRGLINFFGGWFFSMYGAGVVLEGEDEFKDILFREFLNWVVFIFFDWGFLSIVFFYFRLFCNFFFNFMCRN